MEWTKSLFNRHIARLPHSLHLIVSRTTDEDAIRVDLPWEILVFGRSIQNRRTLEEAKKAAEDKAREVLAEALEMLK